MSTSLKLTMEMWPGGVCCIEAVGFLDAHTFENLDDLINGLYNQDSYKIVVNLERLEYISSSGAGVFVGAVGRAKTNGGNIVLLRPSSNVKLTLNTLGLFEMCPLAETKDEAEALLST